jgi:hypothetical protein
MATQNRFKTGLDIAKYSKPYEKDMAEYDAIHLNTQSLGSWHGFVAQQNMIAVKKHHKTTSKKHLSFRLDGCCITFRIWTITRIMCMKKLFQH